LEDYEKMEARLAFQSSKFDYMKLGDRELVAVGLDKGRGKFVTGFVSNVVEGLMSFAFALTGGLALITPMLIMVYNPSKTVSVVTTCVFVLIFAIGLASHSALLGILNVFESYSHSRLRHSRFFWVVWVSRILRESTLQPKDILTATAAYAAVLVVFVGANTSSSI
jgi:hypothetical protein